MTSIGLKEIYWVRQRYYSTGKVEAVIFTESEVHDICKEFRETGLFDEYWDSFDQYDEAEAFYRQCFTC